MRWTKSRLKTLVDSARGKNSCSAAKKFISELDQEYEMKPQRKRSRKKKRSFLDWLFDEE